MLMAFILLITLLWVNSVIPLAIKIIITVIFVLEVGFEINASNKKKNVNVLAPHGPTVVPSSRKDLQ